MKKRCFALLLAAILLLSATAFGEEAAPVRVFDYAGLFTAQEADALEAAIAEFQAATGYDFAILVSDVDHGYDDLQQLCDDFYDTKGLGLGMNHTAILCFLDLYGDGYYYVSVFGDLKYLMSEEDIQYLAENAMSDFYAGDFSGGFQWTMDITRQAVSEFGVQNQSRRVYDYAELLSDADTEALEAAIADFRALSGRDFLYLSTYEEMDGNQNGNYMEEFFLSHGFGEGEQRSGVMIYLDLASGNFYVQNFGDMDTLVPQQDLNVIVGNASPLMAEGEILPAVQQVLDDYAAYFR